MNAPEVKNGIDAMAVVGGFASWLDYAPTVAALLSIIWLLIRIGDWAYLKYNGPEQ